MKSSLLRMAACGILLVPLSSRSQEIRRALPVDRPTPAPPIDPGQYENPAWMDRVLPAIPVTTPAPAPSPTPPPATPPPPPPPLQPTPAPAPAQPEIQESRPPAAPPAPPAPPSSIPAEARDNGEIRFAPGEASRASNLAILQAANGFYSRKLYDMAVPEYEKFLISSPTPKSTGRDEALFRLAESHRFLDHDEAARVGYERLIQEFEKGDYAGAAAYRLAEILFAEKKMDPALAMFRKAHANSPDEEVRLSARFYEARCLDALKRSKEAEPIYTEISGIEKNNPYRDYARLSLAEIRADAGQPKEAIALYMAVAENARRPTLKAEAMVKAGLAAVETGNQEQARDLFRQVWKMPDAGEWTNIARIGAMRAAYAMNDFKALAALTSDDFAALSEDSRPEALLLAGNSLRQLGRDKEAKTLYDRLLAEFPESPSASAARFQRLVTLYSMGSGETLAEINTFLLSPTSTRERTQALLLKAELFFKEKKFAEAAEIYQALQDLPLSDELKSEALYKLGWCEAQVQDYGAAGRIFTRFIEANPKHALAPTAIAQRAMARQAQKDDQGALDDFDLLITKYQGAKEREFALQQKALLLGQKQDTPGMTAAFTQLLDEYPKTAAAAQANFWLGWAAFEAKDYPKAIQYLSEARKLDPKGYGERSSLRIVLACYYQDDRDAAVRELAKMDRDHAPAEILRWLGLKFFEEGKYAEAEAYLLPVSKSGSAQATPEILLILSQSQARQKKWKASRENALRFLEVARDPLNRARGLLAHADTLVGEKRYDEASGIVDEAMLLQPEGRYNALGRMAHADILAAQGEHEKAARAYLTVALLYEDKEITPRALKNAQKEFLLSNNPREAEKTQRELNKRYPDYVSKD